MTICASDVITPMLAAPEVVVLFAAGVAREAVLRDLLGGFVFEGSDFGLVSAALYMSFARPVTGLTPLGAFPLGLRETRMRGL
jgi:hypothetical protein